MTFFEKCNSTCDSKIENDDFINLFQVTKIQSEKFHAKELIMREFEPSKNHPYDQFPIPIYSRGVCGNMILISGNEEYKANINNKYDVTYFKETSFFFQSNRTVNLKEDHLIHLKNSFIEKCCNPMVYKLFEENLVSSIINERPVVNIQMRRLDKNQYRLNNYVSPSSLNS